MSTPPTVPAGWYTDPAARHEQRYWDGTEWTAQVSDGGVTGTDQPGFRPPPGPDHPAEPPSAAPASAAAATTLAAPAPPADAAEAPRGRRKWAVPVIVVAAVVVLGLIAGLVIWAPWKSPPPLLRPTGLTAGPSTTSSVSFRWSRPPTGPLPDMYLILHNGRVTDSVPGTATSYQATGLIPATAYRYRVVAERGGKRSALSSAIVVTTTIPPLSAARLQGLWTVGLKIIKGGGSITGSNSWDETWRTTPKCSAGPCDVRLSGGINGFVFKTTLTRAGTVYRGTIVGNVFPCGSGSGSFPIRSTVKIRITVATARVINGAWTAGSWAGHMVVTAPYTASGNEYCPASRQVAALTGNS
ncbi:MAG TPA: DUF2510 domain-containing protein [Streptosporangiaceae bacterium]|nr:DUF2510 domain-containing protein [Streptosporangiaceae bacterium]